MNHAWLRVLPKRRSMQSMLPLLLVLTGSEGRLSIYNREPPKLPKAKEK